MYKILAIKLLLILIYDHEFNELFLHTELIYTTTTNTTLLEKKLVPPTECKRNV